MSDGSTADRPPGVERRGSGGWERVLESEQHLVGPGSEWRSELYRVAAAQFTRAADVLELPDDIRARLLEPRRSLVVNFPVPRDSGEVHELTGYRVQHTLVMGPTKGGIRLAPGVSLGECAALAMWMTYQCALLGLPFGGSQGGVRCDPNRLSAEETERLIRRYTAELEPIIGPDRDIAGPDMATSEREMAWVMDTYSRGHGGPVPGVVTGKPEGLGGTPVRRDATGLGVVFCLQRVLETIDWTLEGRRFAIQGFGKVGAVIARELVRRGARMVAVADVAGGVANEDGIDLQALSDWVAANRFIRGFDGGERIGRDQVLEIPCDVLIPAALEQQITADNASRLDCELVVEAATGPTTPEADRILSDRGIRVIPDLLANGGGVTVSYFEWAQDIQREPWSDDAVLERLRRQMQSAADKVLRAADRLDVDWRTAAHASGVEPVAHSSALRAVYA